MFKNTFQTGFLSIFYSLGSYPLQLWSQHESIKNNDDNNSDDDNGDDDFQEGTIKNINNQKIRIINDEIIKSNVLQIIAENITNVYIQCPPRIDQNLGITLQYLTIIVKDMDDFFSFEIEILDDKKEIKFIRVSNFQEETRVKDEICCLPLRLEEEKGWNNITLDLNNISKRAFGTAYSETRRVTVHANCRLRRIYFSQQLFSEDELPPELKLYIPSN
eukprot:TRINITY_DN1303_c0_g2_i1.p1 TRINITY_DN1303_c0_g2~~TRINITY_DN1303_c0_g2_i1.p1  ORF type:complete len:218 (+),score=54.37 TRINITY_DN1303_c0_g2_i1:73-726(+)